jgi:hypothetical protein
MTSTFSATGSNGVKIEFPGTNATATTSSYAIQKNKMFNRLVSIIDSANKSKVTMLLNLEEKHSLENVTITNIVSTIFCFEFRNRYCIDYYNKRFY